MTAGTTLLEASAGTGKTFEIAHTVLRKVAEDGVDIRRIVVVTFTDAAAAELRDRVRSRLRDARDALGGRPAPDDVLVEWARSLGDPAVAEWRLRTALQVFDEAEVSTIHAFAKRVLSRWALETKSGLGSNAVGNADPLLTDIVADYWARTTWAAPAALLPALVGAGVTIDGLLDLAKKASDPDVRVVPDVPPADLPSIAAWVGARAVLTDLWDAPAIVDAVAQADVVRRRSLPKWPESYPDAETANQAWAAESDSRSVGPGGPLPAWAAYFRAARLATGTRTGPTPSHPALAALESWAEEHERIAGPMLAYIRRLKPALVDDVRTRLPARLRERGERTFDDLLRDLRTALDDQNHGERLRADVRSRFDLALVDEFQDTDPVQWDIFRVLFGDALTLVGDPKQAIYAFRGADIHTYRRAATLVVDQRPLDTSFRADGPLVRAVNHLFGREGLERPFGADWPAFHPVRAHHEASRLQDDDRSALEIRFLPRSSGAAVDRNLLSGRWLRERLPELVASDVVDELERRGRIADRVTAGDCAVLVRSNDQARDVVSALRARGVPAVRRSDDSVWASPVARELVSILAAILEPGSDRLRRTALVSTILGCSASDLVRMDTDDGLAERASERFHRWKATWTDQGFEALATQLLDEGVAERLLGGEQGERRLTDLRQLLELAADEAWTRKLGPGPLLEWLRHGSPDPERSRVRLETDEAAVQVVTVHGAKGLEYPLVWCPYLWSGGFVTEEDQVHLLFHDAEGRRALDLGSPDYDDHLGGRKDEQLQEDRRLIYVAVTRARHRCVVYFGAAAYTSALGSLLQAPDIQRYGDADDEQLRAALRPVTDHPDIGLTEVDWCVGTEGRWRRDGAAARLEVRALTRSMAPDRWWRRSSFTALTKGGESADPIAFVDHDDASDDAAASTPSTDVLPLAGLSGGVETGKLLHAILERHEFTAPAGLRPLVEECLADHGRPAAEADQVVAAIQGILDTVVMADGFRFASLPGRRRIAELEFAFPLRGDRQDRGPLLDVRALARAFEHPDAPQGYDEALRRLTFVPVRGFLVGSIDLVFEHAGRFWLVDWKSNWLGGSFADYSPSALDRSMRDAHYVLQLHLYAVALHRYLRTRVAGYAWDTRVGGAMYLFLRGMEPGRTTGIYTCRPTAAFVEHLDGVLSGRTS